MLLYMVRRRAILLWGAFLGCMFLHLLLIDTDQVLVSSFTMSTNKKNHDRIWKQKNTHRLCVKSRNDDDDDDSVVSRREFGSVVSKQTVGTSLIGGTSNLFLSRSPVANAANNRKNGLAERLSQRDPSALSNSVFNLPPRAQIYPDFLHGSWNLTLQYNGYLFPSTKILKSTLTADVQIPGFQKCSIAYLSDVGKDIVSYQWNIDPKTGLEDRNRTFTTSINSHLGYPAVQEILYNPKSNPNRLSIIFYEYRTTNAERIELFCNGRESELIEQPVMKQQQEQQQQSQDDETTASSSSRKVFVWSEYIRQVTFGTGSQVGIPRQVITNYAHFWTYKETSDNPDTITGNVLTAAYLDPQDPLFFQEPTQPVAIYSHVLTAKRI